MPGQQQPHRAGKASLVVILVLVGAVCLIVGGLCGGGITFFMAVRPVQREMEQAMPERELVQHEAQQIGKAVESVGGLFSSATSKAAAPQTAPSRPDSEVNARIIFENIRAARPQAIQNRCSPDFRQVWYQQNVAEQLAKHALPLRTEALGDDVLTLPPIDDNTHQYRYTTKTTDGRPVTFTITMVFVSRDGFSPTEWLLDQLTITEGEIAKATPAEKQGP